VTQRVVQRHGQPIVAIDEEGAATPCDGVTAATLAQVVAECEVEIERLRAEVMHYIRRRWR